MFISLLFFDCVGSSLQSPGSPVEACEVGSAWHEGLVAPWHGISDPQPGIESTSPIVLNQWTLGSPYFSINRSKYFVL